MTQQVSVPSLNREHFDQYGYIVLHNVIEQDMIDEIYNFWIKRDKEDFFKEVEDAPFTDVHNYNLRAREFNKLEKVHKDLMALLRKELKMATHPTYNMGRVNKRNQIMRKHTDRLPCEISITMPIAYSDAIWPIWVDSPGKGHKGISLEVGDILVYKGCEVVHWRDRNTFSDTTIQHYFHYVNLDTVDGIYYMELMGRHTYAQGSRLQNKIPGAISHMIRAGDLPVEVK